MTKTCRQNPEHAFEVTDKDMAFYARIGVPEPKLCPDCRLQLRMSFRHGGKLHNRRCDLTGKEIIAMHPADAPFPVYDQAEWWGDGWDAGDYARDIDWDRPFLQQVAELSRAVPHIALVSTNSENCRYTNHLLNSKNCYLVVGGSHDEDTYYSHYVNRTRSSLDCLAVTNCELCYEGVASSDCHSCSFFTDSRGCTDCLFIEDCQGCTDCIGCFGLRNAQYHVFNEPVGKERYEEMLRSITPLSRANIAKIRAKFEALKADKPRRHARLYNCEDCTGDALWNCRNCHHAFDSRDGQDSKFVCFTPKAIDSYDCTFNAPDGVELCYQALSTVGVRGGISTHIAWGGNDVAYSMECHNCSNVFGCVGLKRQEYRILNKAYPKAEYEALTKRIKEGMLQDGTWGEFFPPAMSLHAYNESAAQDYFPLTEAEVREAGWTWYEGERTTMHHGRDAAVPERITETDDGIVHHVLSCSTCDRNYTVIAQELRFYRERGLPVPLSCFFCRHAARVGRRHPRRLFHRTCGKCGTTIATTYAPDRSETVYCEKCYLGTVY